MAIPCSEHGDMCQKIGDIDATVRGHEPFFIRIERHMEEGVGVRDRLSKLEMVLQQYLKHQEEKEKRFMWQIGLLVSVVVPIANAVLSSVIRVIFR